MPQYELVVILGSLRTEEDRTATLERLEGVITKNGGSIVKREVWGKRRLAYPIQKFRDGVYAQIDFLTETNTKVLEELGRELRIAEDLLRSLVTVAVLGKSKGKPLSAEEMAKINYRPPGARRPFTPRGDRPAYTPREGGYQPREGGYQPREGGYQRREQGADYVRPEQPAVEAPEASE